MADPVFSLQIELEAGSWTNVASKDLLKASWERSLSDLFTPLRDDQALFELANVNGTYSPKKNALLIPGKRVRLTATHAGSSYSLYSGRIREVKQSPGWGQQTAVIEALSEVDRINRTMLTTPLFTNINAASLFTEIMTRCSVASFACEALFDTVPFATYKDRPATEALDELVKSGNYKLFLDGNGTVQLKSRYYGVFDTSQSSLTEFYDLQYALNPDSVVNDVKLNGVPRAASGISTLSFIPTAIAMPASGGSVGLWLAYTDPNEPSLVTPAQSVVTPVASTDWYVAANSDGTGTNLTSAFALSFTAFGATAVATVTNNGAAATGYLSRLQVRGHPVLRNGQIAIRNEHTSSQALYGRQGFEIQNVLIQNYPYLRDFGQAIIGDRAAPRDDVQHALKNDWPEQLVREPGHVVSMIESAVGINSQWSIKRAEHEVSLASGLEHTTTFYVDGFNDAPWLVLDHPSFGKLDSGRQLAF